MWLVSLVKMFCTMDVIIDDTKCGIYVQVY